MPDNLSCDLQQNRLHLPDCRAHTVFKGEHVLQTSKPSDLNMQKNKMWMPGLEKWHPTTKYHWINTNNRKESRKFSISVMVSFTSFQRWILHRGVSLSINNKGILKIVFSKVFSSCPPRRQAGCYLGNRGFVFLHQLVHVLLILLHPGLQVILLPLQTADLLLQLKHWEEQDLHTLQKKMTGFYSWAIEYDKWSLAGRAVAVLESHLMAMKHNLDGGSGWRMRPIGDNQLAHLGGRRVQPVQHTGDVLFRVHSPCSVGGDSGGPSICIL